MSYYQDPPPEGVNWRMLRSVSFPPIIVSIFYYLCRGTSLLPSSEYLDTMMSVSGIFFFGAWLLAMFFDTTSLIASEEEDSQDEENDDS